MAVDLFSIVLSSAISWGVSYLLDSIVRCTNCGSQETRSVPNCATAWQTCRNCGYQLDQYTNATIHTVNQNKSIIAAYASSLTWDSWGGFWGTPFKPRFDIDVLNSKYEDVVARIVLSKYQGQEFNRYEMIFRPTYEHTRWSDTWMSFPRDSFPSGSGTFACDLYIFNTWGEELHRIRSLGNYKNMG